MGILKFKKGLLVYLVPATLMYSVFFIYPFIQTLYYSFFEWDGIFEPVFNGVKNFTAVFKERVFQESIVRVVKWAVLAGVLQSGLGLTLAFLLRGKAKCNSLFRSAYFVPVVISSAAVCVMFTVMYDKDIGLVNSFLDGVGLGSLKHVWLGDRSVAFYATIAVPIWQAMGLFVMIMFSGLQSIPEELYEAAQIDGANSWNLFWKITVPLMIPIIQICVVLSVSNSFKNFDYIYMLTGGGPVNSTQVPATMMYSKAFAGMQYGMGTAVAVVICVLSGIFVTAVRAGFDRLDR